MTLKSHLIEKLAIGLLLIVISISTIGSEYQVGSGFRVDTMDACKSYEVEDSIYNHRLPDHCISVFEK